MDQLLKLNVERAYFYQIFQKLMGNELQTLSPQRMLLNNVH